MLTDLEMPGGDANRSAGRARDAQPATPPPVDGLEWLRAEEPELVFYASHGIPILSKSLPTAEIARLLLARANVTIHTVPR
ncbi:MAG: hypothetical protein IPJ34_43720 [Myxococcales bacterium]|nr:hypothetical protein [Myxococcales bacterium]